MDYQKTKTSSTLINHEFLQNPIYKRFYGTEKKAELSRQLILKNHPINYNDILTPKDTEKPEEEFLWRRIRTEYTKYTTLIDRLNKEPKTEDFNTLINLTLTKEDYFFRACFYIVLNIEQHPASNWLEFNFTLYGDLKMEGLDDTMENFDWTNNYIRTDTLTLQKELTTNRGVFSSNFNKAELELKRAELEAA